METTIFNLDITLNNEQSELLNSLSGFTDMTAQELLNNVVNGERTWEDYAEINEMHKIRTNPNLGQWFNSEEVDQCLKTGIFPN